MSHEYKNPAVELALNNIIDTFSNADAAFVCFLAMIRTLDKQASEGDKAAQQLLKIVLNFSKLIEVSQQHS